MAAIEFRVKVIRSPAGTTATVAEVSGSIDATTIQQFQEVLDKLIERGVRNLILDCTNVRYINSTGLGTLLKYVDTFESLNGHLAFCRVPSKVMLVMEMLGFNALFTIVSDEAAALRAFAGRPPEPVPEQAPGPPAVAAVPARALAPAPPVAGLSFPLRPACARCRVTLEVPAVGKFKCPRCGAILAVEPTGRVRFFASKKARPLEICLPCNKELLAGVAQLAGQCAGTLGFAEEARRAVAAAVDEACRNVMDWAYGGDPASVFHLLILPDANALTIRIADHGKPFEFGAAGSIYGDPRFARVVRAMDTVEHRLNPRGGNLLTLIKVLP